MIFRTVQKKDIPQCKEIWSEVFNDSYEFVDWFFLNRFSPDLGVCCEDNGKIVSVIHGFPMPVKYLGKKRRGAMMSGVATIPSYRGQGLMHKLMNMFKKNLSAKGFELFVYKAADPKIYYSCDQYPCTMQGHFTYKKSCEATALLNTEFDVSEALDIYSAFSKNYNGIILRDINLMTLRSQDFLVDGCKFYNYDHRAYCFVSLKDDIARIHELCYRNPRDIFPLLDNLPVNKISGVLPADYPFKDLFSEFSVNIHGTIVLLAPELIPQEPSELSIGKRTEKLLLCPSAFILDEY